MKVLNDRLDSLLQPVDEDKTPNVQLHTVARTNVKPGFVENRGCARCVGECKVF